MSTRFVRNARSEKGSVLAEYVYLLLGVVVTTALALSILGSEIAAGLSYVGYHIDTMIEGSVPNNSLTQPEVIFNGGLEWDGEFVYDPLVSFDTSAAAVLHADGVLGTVLAGAIEAVNPISATVFITLPELTPP